MRAAQADRPREEEWLLIEWPKGETEPTRYFLSTLPANTPFKELVGVVKMRRRIERDYRELKQEVGLGQLRRAQLARFPSSRKPVYRGLWFPDAGAAVRS